MDVRIRELERKARAGDAEAARRLLGELSRTGDLAAQYDVLMLMAELQNPGLLKQLEEINKLIDQSRVQMPPVEDGVFWSTEIRLSDNTGQ